MAFDSIQVESTGMPEMMEKEVLKVIRRAEKELL